MLVETFTSNNVGITGTGFEATSRPTNQVSDMAGRAYSLHCQIL